MPHSGVVRLISLACLGSWALLTAMQFQWIPFTRYWWGFNFWGYLSSWVGPCLAAAALLLCSGAVRDGIWRVATRAGGRLGEAPRPVFGALGLGLLVLGFWSVRERHLFGDSSLLILAIRHDWHFVFPESGATFFMYLSFLLGDALSFGGRPAVQLLSCLCGALTVPCVLRAARHLAPPGTGVAVALLILSGGIVRIFAGHIEVYSVLIAAVAAYLWLALAFLEGRCPWYAPCLALGFAVWVHACAACLLPSLAVLPFLGSPGTRLAERLRRGAIGFAIASLPSIVFLLALLAVGEQEDLLRALDKSIQILGQDPDPLARSWWVRGWGGEPSIGTDVVFLSRPHLKYLANAAYVLAPSAIPVLLAFALAAPRGFVATPTRLFLLAASVPAVAYATLLRPFWGPFDWDLFSITAICLAALAGHLLSTGLGPIAFRHAAIWLIGFHLLFVTIPFVAIGLGSVRNAGPFVPGSFRLEMGLLPKTPPPEEIAPWF